MFSWFKKSAPSTSSEGLLATKAEQKGSKPKFHPLTVLEVRRETSDSVSVSFEVPEGAEFRYLPGQYLTLKAEINGAEVRRSYSLCSSPLSGTLRVAIKQVEGGVFSTWANTQLKAGDVLDVMPPMGNFLLETDPAQRRRYVGFAAGSGITPVLSILKTALEREPESEFLLFYGNRKTASILFKNELEDLKDRYMGRLEVHHVLSREDQGSDALFGRLDADRIRYFADHIPTVTKADGYFLCGPEPMIHAASEVLKTAGVSADKIHFELFTAAAPAAAPAAKADKGSASGDAYVTVVLDGEETHFTQSAKEFVLDAALDAGADVPYACKGAVCCTCRAKVLEGTVEMAMNYSLTDDEVAEGYVLTCQAMPRSERVVVSYDA
ncbi:MAG: 1,2-phenylacetyl-CoA epoxidase subunit PaaE [Bacteroidota bacterium]|jgi:ring-1,2-phenylacetyl-CoA epoxidase subunit PaaE